MQNVDREVHFLEEQVESFRDVVDQTKRPEFLDGTEPDPPREVEAGRDRLERVEEGVPPAVKPEEDVVNDREDGVHPPTVLYLFYLSTTPLSLFTPSHCPVSLPTLFS